MLLGAGCSLALVALMIRVSFNRKLLYCRELLLIQLFPRSLASPFWEVTFFARTVNEGRWARILVGLSR